MNKGQNAAGVAVVREVPLLEKFDAPLPVWISDIEAEVSARISSALFARLLYKGDVEVARALCVGLWPFINEFPKIVSRGKLRLARLRLIRAFKPGELRELLRRSAKVLETIQQDEEEHRYLWLRVGKAIGLQYPEQFSQYPLPAVKAWIEAVDQLADPLTMFLRFAAIEVVGEATSLYLLTSPRFCEMLGKNEGLKWFKEHATHSGDMSHAELSLRLGFALHDPEDWKPTRAKCNTFIQDIVGHAISATNACLALVKGGSVFSRLLQALDRHISH